MSEPEILKISHSLNSKSEYTVFKCSSSQDVSSKAVFSLSWVMLRLKILKPYLITMIPNFPVVPS